MSDTYTWEIEGTLDTDSGYGSVKYPGETHHYRRPVWFIASAPTLEEALEKVKVKHPDIIFVKGYRTRHVEGVIT